MNYQILYKFMEKKYYLGSYEGISIFIKKIPVSTIKFLLVNGKISDKLIDNNLFYEIINGMNNEQWKIFIKKSQIKIDKILKIMPKNKEIYQFILSNNNNYEFTSKFYENIQDYFDEILSKNMVNLAFLNKYLNDIIKIRGWNLLFENNLLSTSDLTNFLNKIGNLISEDEWNNYLKKNKKIIIQKYIINFTENNLNNLLSHDKIEHTNSALKIFYQCKMTPQLWKKVLSKFDKETLSLLFKNEINTFFDIDWCLNYMDFVESTEDFILTCKNHVTHDEYNQLLKKYFIKCGNEKITEKIKKFIDCNSKEMIELKIWMILEPEKYQYSKSFYNYILNIFSSFINENEWLQIVKLSDKYFDICENYVLNWTTQIFEKINNKRDFFSLGNSNHESYKTKIKKIIFYMNKFQSECFYSILYELNFIKSCKKNGMYKYEYEVINQSNLLDNIYSEKCVSHFDSKCWEKIIKYCDNLNELKKTNYEKYFDKFDDECWILFIDSFVKLTELKTYEKNIKFETFQKIIEYKIYSRDYEDDVKIQVLSLYKEYLNYNILKRIFQYSSVKFKKIDPYIGSLDIKVVEQIINYKICDLYNWKRKNNFFMKKYTKFLTKYKEYINEGTIYQIFITKKYFNLLPLISEKNLKYFKEMLKNIEISSNDCDEQFIIKFKDYINWEKIYFNFDLNDDNLIKECNQYFTKNIWNRIETYDKIDEEIIIKNLKKIDPKNLIQRTKGKYYINFFEKNYEKFELNETDLTNFITSDYIEISKETFKKMALKFQIFIDWEKIWRKYIEYFDAEIINNYSTKYSKLINFYVRDINFKRFPKNIFSKLSDDAIKDFYCNKTLYSSIRIEILSTQILSVSKIEEIFEKNNKNIYDIEFEYLAMNYKLSKNFIEKFRKRFGSAICYQILE